jgi:hypothetical protein
VSDGTIKTWQQKSADRRDERATKAPEKPTKYRSSKKTRTWCKGKVGVEHQRKCVPYDDVKARIFTTDTSAKWRVLVCTACGKELALWCPFNIRGREPKKVPDWVDC